MLEVRTCLLAPVSILAVALVACGRDEAADRSTRTTVTDSAGIEIVRNDPVGSLGELQLEETLRLGRVDGKGPDLFSRIVAVRWGPDGRIYVGNGGSASVRVFDKDGAFLVEFGGLGGGPAELPVMLNDVIVAPDSVVLVDWQQNGRILLFDGGGEFLHGRAVRGPDGTAHVPTHRTPDGWLVAVSPRYERPDLDPGEPLVRFRDLHLMSLDAREPGPLLHRIPGVPVYGVRSDGGDVGVDWRLFEIGNRHSAFDAAGRLYLTSDDAYRIDVFDVGQLVRSVRRDFPLRAITSDDVEAYREASLAIIDTLPMPDEVRPDQREGFLERVDRQAALGLPDVLGPFSGLLVSPDGSFWAGVRTDVTPAEVEVRFMWDRRRAVPLEPTTWDLFDESGVYLGGVTLPARFLPHAVDGLEVIGVQTDDLDVEYVVRYDVLPDGTAGGGSSR